ncbi:MAG: hypothetical protein WC727_03840, partial [Ignavibacteriaceae bacterium]
MEEKIFCWSNFDNWKTSFAEFIQIVFPDNIFSLIEKHKGSIEGIDWAGQLEEYVHDDNDNYYYDSEFLQYFKNTYSHLLTFHGCRPSDILSYYKYGLLVLDVELQNKYYEKMFLNKNFNKVTLDDFNFAISTLKKEKRENELYLAIDDKELIEFAGHYLIYGSEYIMCLAAILSERIGIDYKASLREIGKPTVFKIKLPVYLVNDKDISHMFKYLFRLWIYNTVHKTNFMKSLDHSFLIKT